MSGYINLAAGVVRLLAAAGAAAGTPAGAAGSAAGTLAETAAGNAAGALAEAAAESTVETLAGAAAGSTAGAAEADAVQAAAELVQKELLDLKPNIVATALEDWGNGLASFGIRLAIAILIIVIGFRLVRALQGVMARTFEKMGIDLSVSRFLTSVINTAAHALIIFIAAEKIGIPSASIIALLGSAGLAIGLSLQGSLANVAGGILVMLMRPFAVGDYIMCNDVEGTVHNIDLAYTTLVTIDNKKIMIPNGTISNSTVVNVTAQDKRRLDVRIKIGYSADLKQAKEILLGIYENHPLILKDQDIKVFVNELTDSAVVLGGFGWTLTDDYWNAMWDILEQVKLEFERAGIEIGHNQVDVTIKKQVEK